MPRLETQTKPGVPSMAGCGAAASRGRRRHRSPSPPLQDHGVSNLSESEGSRTDSRHRRRRKGRGRNRSGKRSRCRRGRSRGSSSDSDVDSETSYESRKRSRRSSHNRSSGTKSKGSDFCGSGKHDRAAKGNVKAGDEKKDAIESKNMSASRKQQPAPDDDPAPLVGPLPLPHVDVHVKYGGALRPGEGDAMAQFVQQGKRIPRRGEVGLSAEEIQRFEEAGYVMSGSRHSRITAVRLRKENQVYSAEEKRALATFNYEQRAMRESKVRDDLRRLVDKTLGKLAETQHDPFAMPPSR
ncbi:hypothetical protein CFC21_102638 [Triticum aestivum]|uniref:NF-kappa-B-activating protein C-terminal domain-containing protein n=2 Tax=Triticum aestivum TaxID=4565 RepID=A0A9R1M5W3_WHEAT|nr:NF-kappa-B-activating protein-like [Triticum aestivum]KAF7101256.1 hypothetical protein CFC21_102638 [Triticum aestivum]